MQLEPEPLPSANLAPNTIVRRQRSAQTHGFSFVAICSCLRTAVARGSEPRTLSQSDIGSAKASTHRFINPAAALSRTQGTRLA